MKTRPEVKILLIGDSSVGKSSILSQLDISQFSPTYKATIGPDFIRKDVTIEDQPVTLQIWDTPGQERFRPLSTASYRNANVFLIVFDVTKQATFDSIPSLIEEAKPYSPDAQIVLVANKCDLENRTVENARTYAESIGATYHEVSAANNSGINDMFESIAAAHAQKSISQNDAAPSIKNNKIPEFTLDSVAGITLDQFKVAYYRKYQSQWLKNFWSSFMLNALNNDLVDNWQFVLNHANAFPNGRSAIVLRELIQKQRLIAGDHLSYDRAGLARMPQQR